MTYCFPGLFFQMIYICRVSSYLISPWARFYHESIAILHIMTVVVPEEFEAPPSMMKFTPLQLLMVQKSSQPFEVGSLSDYLQGFSTILGGSLGFLNHQQYRIDGTGIFTLIWHKHQPRVGKYRGKYTNPMDLMWHLHVFVLPWPHPGCQWQMKVYKQNM